mmetsp:Transcript_4666/g.16719  ORF Transcript_4666/g.16719 Transcript_4666/m.16719 type:complete len:133 (-) Transcript_4666:595-993(-)|eukprot:scaffold60_cov382-Prasinococcus_capsulatus_cf.AAC.10
MLTATQSASFLGGGVKLPAAAGSPRCPGAPTRLGVRCAKDVLGKVVSTANDKTAVVEVRRNFAHKLYGKRITTSKKYHAHDEENEAQVGADRRLWKAVCCSASCETICAKLRVSTGQWLTLARGVCNSGSVG